MSKHKDLLENSLKHRKSPYLVVDLDGTLISCSTTRAEFLASLFHREMFTTIIKIRKMPKRLFNFKYSLSECGCQPIFTNCFNREVLDLIRGYQNFGSKVILATASFEKSARHAISEKDINFIKILCSSNDFELKGYNKYMTLMQEINYQDFDYIGDSLSDIILLENAKTPFIVKSSARKYRKVRARLSNEAIAKLVRIDIKRTCYLINHIFWSD